MGIWSKITKELAREKGFGKRYKGEYFDDHEKGPKSAVFRALHKAVRKYFKKD